jgi:hypothetical protein
MKNIIVVAAVFVALCLCMTPVSSRDVIDNVPTIYIGEEHLNLKFLEGDRSKTFGWWEGGFYMSSRTAPGKVITLDSYTDVSFPESEFGGYAGPWFQLDSNRNVNLTAHYFTLVAPVVTPTPVPTPSTGNIVISSSPSDATVYVDNVIKGITPLTIQEKNGEHVVKIRLYGYQEYTTTVVVNGEDVSINPMLIPMTTVATTVATTVPTTVPTTIITTMPTTEPTVEPTIEPTMEIMGLEQPVNNNDTLAAIQSQIDEQATKNAEQDVVIAEQSEQIDVLTQIINFILSFLGVK